jgi:hypothetical protein
MADNQNSNPEPNQQDQDKTKPDRKTYQAEYYEKNKEQLKAKRKATRLERHKERLATDPEYQKKYAEYNEKRRASRKERLATDPEYQKHTRESYMTRHRRRMETDPEYRLRYQENTDRQNERRRRLREEAKQRAEDKPPADE